MEGGGGGGGGGVRELAPSLSPDCIMEEDL